MESAVPKDAPNPGNPFHVKAADDLVSAAVIGDELLPTRKVVVSTSGELDVHESKAKAVSIQKFKHENFQIMEVIVQLAQISEAARPFGLYIMSMKKISRRLFILICLTAPRKCSSLLFKIGPTAIPMWSLPCSTTRPVEKLCVPTRTLLWSKVVIVLVL